MAQNSHNSFRSNWRYMRLPAGDAMLEAGKGLSPAFMNLLAAIDPRSTITFDELSDAFPAMDADDLELWLAELCRMELISPAEPPGVGLREVRLELEPVPETMAQPLAKRPNGSSAETVVTPTPASQAGHAGTNGAPRPALQSELTTPGLPINDNAISVLLVDKSPEEREIWRQALAVLPINLFEAGTLAEADSGFREHKPQAVVMGMTGVDFKALHLIGLLKHPRNRFRTKVFLMMEDRSTVSQNDLRTAQMADATIPIEAITRLVEEVAQRLALSVPSGGAVSAHAEAAMASGTAAQAAESASPNASPHATTHASAPTSTPANTPARPLKDAMSVTQRLLYAGNPDASAAVTDPRLLSSLEQRYPRVTLELVERWGKPSLEGFLDNLILDSRGNRQGFAPDAMEELLLLYSVHREYRPANEFWYLNAEAQTRSAKQDKLGTTGTSKRLR